MSVMTTSSQKVQTRTSRGTIRALAQALSDIDRNIEEMSSYAFGSSQSAPKRGEALGDAADLLKGLRRKRQELQEEVTQWHDKEEERRIQAMTKALQNEDNFRFTAAEKLKRICDQAKNFEEKKDQERITRRMAQAHALELRNKKILAKVTEREIQVKKKADAVAEVRQHRHEAAQAKMLSRSMGIYSSSQEVPRHQRKALLDEDYVPLCDIQTERPWLQPKITPRERAARLARDRPTVPRHCGHETDREYLALDRSLNDLNQRRTEKADERRRRLKAKGKAIHRAHHEKQLKVDEKLLTIAEEREEHVASLQQHRSERQAMLDKQMGAQKVFQAQRSQDLRRMEEGQRSIARESRGVKDVELVPLRRCLQHAERLLAQPRPDTTPPLCLAPLVLAHKHHHGAEESNQISRSSSTGLPACNSPKHRFTHSPKRQVVNTFVTTI